MSSGPATAIRSAYRRLSGHRNSAETRIATRTGACHYTNRLNDRSRLAPSQCPVRLRASPLVCDCAVKRLPGMAREVRLHLPDHVIDLGETLLLVGGPRPRGRSLFSWVPPSGRDRLGPRTTRGETLAAVGRSRSPRQELLHRIRPDRVGAFKLPLRPRR
jgi:hypothetical protein